MAGLFFFLMKSGLKNFDADFTGNLLYNSCKKILDLPTTSVSQEYVGQGGRRWEYSVVNIWNQSSNPQNELPKLYYKTVVIPWWCVSISMEKFSTARVLGAAISQNSMLVPYDFFFFQYYLPTHSRYLIHGAVFFLPQSHFLPAAQPHTATHPLLSHGVR